jgi:hypothetical protein
LCCSEYLFTEENLCMDTFLRSYMDEAGYVPLAVVCAYPNVAYFNVPVDALMAALTQACAQADSPLELDLAVGTIKLKNKWEMVRGRFLVYHTVTLMDALQWVMPNANGGRGLPLYSVQAQQAQAAAATATSAPPSTTSAATNGTTSTSVAAHSPASGRRSRSGTEELSPKAPEFVPATKASS